MDPDKQKRLNRLIWRQRLRSALPVVAIFGLLAALFVGLFWDEQDAVRETTTGRVASWSRAPDETGNGPFIVTVVLPDGARANATGSAAGPAPQVGQTIKLVRSETKSGRIRYRWMR
ncbi:MAG: hypothetical protein MPJ78_18590 [Hyphomicrobiaceae bacterium]|nr:hypothetical protein [Hyphomicrobiaceae bacterium]